MPIKRRSGNPHGDPVNGLVPRHVLPPTLTEYLRERRASGVLDVNIEVPFSEGSNQYGMLAVSMDELIKLAERAENPVANVAKSAALVKIKPKPKLLLRRG